MPRKAADRPDLDASTRIALLTGPELYLHIEHTDRLREALRAAHGEIGIFQFDGATTPVAVVLDECRTFGLMQGHKLVIVDNADQFVKSAGDDDDGSRASRRTLVERYAESPCEGATLVLRSEKWHKGNLDKMIEQVGAVIRCDRFKAPEAVAWAIERCPRRHGAALEPAAAAMLVERTGPDLAKIESELGRLALSVAGPKGKPGSISTAVVRELVGVSREEEVWVIQSALLAGDGATALRAVREALDVSRHHPVLVSWACVDLARKLHGASRGLAAGARPFELMKALKLWGSGGEAVLNAARRIDSSRAASLFREAVECDVRQKTGRTDPERALEALALRFASV